MRFYNSNGGVFFFLQQAIYFFDFLHAIDGQHHKRPTSQYEYFRQSYSLCRLHEAALRELQLTCRKDNIHWWTLRVSSVKYPRRARLWTVSHVFSWCASHARQKENHFLLVTKRHINLTGHLTMTFVRNDREHFGNVHPSSMGFWCIRNTTCRLKI